jgi:hypothetical protein
VDKINKKFSTENVDNYIYTYYIVDNIVENYGKLKIKVYILSQNSIFSTFKHSKYLVFKLSTFVVKNI